MLPYRDFGVNVHLLAGDPLALVDFGPAGPEPFRALVAGLRDAGVDPADLRLLILTHLHDDHADGLRDLLAAAPDARVLAHPWAAAGLRDPAADRERRQRFQADLLREAGALSLLQPPRPAPEAWSPPPDRLREIGEGDRVEAGGASWRVLHTPGHAQTQICLFDAAEGALLSSDHLMRGLANNTFFEPAGPGGPAGRPPALLQYREHLRRVAALPVHTAYPGHGGPFGAVATVVDDQLKRQEARCRQLTGLLAAGPATPHALAREAFPRLRGRAIYLGICQVLGHLDLLEQRGQVRRGLRDGTAWYTLLP